MPALLAARGGAEGLFFLLNVNLLVLRALVHDYFDDHSAAALGTFSGRINFVILDQPPLSARAPVAVELVVGVERVLLRMLPPVRVGHVEAVRGFVVLFLENGEELVDEVLLRPVAKLIRQEAHDNYDADDGKD